MANPTEDKVLNYIKSIENGDILACKQVKLAVKRYKLDRKTAESRCLKFIEADAIHAIEFIERFIFHTVGPCAGNPFILNGWQSFILWNLFGFKKADGSRRFRIAHISCARKQGKSTLASAVGIYLLIADGESAGEVYSIATKKDQAKIVFSEAKRQIRTSPDLKNYAKVLTHNISVPETFSKFEALGADSDTLDGLNISCALCDEIHAWKSRELWDVIRTATGARRQPLIFAITTAGFDKSEASICWLNNEYGEKILNGIIEDDSFFVFIATLDPEDAWDDEKLYIKANPNLGISVKIEDLIEEANQVKNSPTGLNPFKRYKLNIWTEASEAWLTPEQWNACNKGEINVAELQDRPCYMGLDLSKKVDTSAVVLVFPPFADDPDFVVLPFIFVPGETLADREKTERIPWLSWKARGLIHACEGSKVIQMDDILDLIELLDSRFDIRDIVYDRWRSPEILPQLESMAWSADPNDKKAVRYLVEHGQGYRGMSPAIRNLEEIAIEGRLNHSGHEVLAHQMSCVTLSEDDAGNVKFSKRKSKGHIDAVVALAMATYRASLFKEQK